MKIEFLEQFENLAKIKKSEILKGKFLGRVTNMDVDIELLDFDPQVLYIVLQC